MTCECRSMDEDTVRALTAQCSLIYEHFTTLKSRGFGHTRFQSDWIYCVDVDLNFSFLHI